MQRRDFLLGAGASAALGAATARAADGQPVVRWRLASSYPKSLDTLYGASEVLANRVAALTEGRFQIRPFAAGEIVPGLQALDAVQQGTVECGHTLGSFYVGKNRAFAFDSVLPFGLTTRQQTAWMHFGNGLTLLRELYRDYGVINFPGGNTGAQMGGWFRKELQGLADLKGLKMRIPGLGGEIMARLGAVPQTIPGADVYPALEKGAIDAAEWSGPYDDEKLGFFKVARYYYHPGWWEPSAQLSFLVNAREWEKLPKAYQQAFEVAAAEAHLLTTAEYDAKNPPALTRLLAQGVKLRRFPEDVMKAAYKTAFVFYDEEAERNPVFRKIYNDWLRFRSQQQAWFRIGETGIENFMYSQNLQK